MLLETLNERSRGIFRQIVEAYLATGDPVGSRTLSRLIDSNLSPATIRNVMADLEDSGLIASPHTSAGRIPTQLGLRMFVDGLLEIGDLTSDERQNIEAQCLGKGRPMAEVLGEATAMLSGLSHCAGMVMVPKMDKPLKHIEFVMMGPGRVLVVLVLEGDDVENRVIEVPPGTTPSSLQQAANYLNMNLRGRTIAEAQNQIKDQLDKQKAELDALTREVVTGGLAVWAGNPNAAATPQDTLIVRGQANLLEDVKAAEDLERIRLLFQDLETKKDLLKVLGLARQGEGVRIFIGSENNLFSLSGSSVIAAPYMDGQNNVLGVIGVIGPTRLNYARIIPMVDYTAKIIGHLL